jgi:methyltransferase (TIGR00027 family)
MNSTEFIRHISDTALWVAVYRARESERGDAVFRDPYASKLAGNRGIQIARAMPFAQRHSWSFVARTWLIDEVIERELSRGTDLVINLAAGLDTRPYRMRLPASLRWIEVDLSDLQNYKQEILAEDRPNCAVERVALDLRDQTARRALFRRLQSEANRVLILSEGLLIYLADHEVAELARDLSSPPNFRLWVTDLTSPALLKMLQKTIGGPLERADSPPQFAPREGPNFFAAHGWKTVEARSVLHAAAKLKRLSLGMRLLSLLPDPAGRRPDKPWGGVCVFENTTSA